MVRNKKTSSRPARSGGSYAKGATIDDIPKDDLDSFEDGRDSILLDGDYNQVGNGDDEDEDELIGQEREILGFDHADHYADSDEEEEDEDEGDYDEFEQDDGYQNLPAPKAKGKKVTAPVSDDSDDYDDEEEEDEGIHENDKGWGPNKRAYYNTNNLDDIESDSEIDEEQARELELKEVKRLQKKSRSAMDDSDFGLGDDEVEGGLGKALKDAGREKRRQELDGEESKKDAKAAGAPVSAPLPQDPGSRKELLAKLQKVSPETVALAGEYADMVEEFNKVDAALKKVMAEKPGHPILEVLHLHHQTLITYLTTITFYFHLRASAEYASSPAKLTSHPVLLRMMKLKQALSVMEELGLSFDNEDSARVLAGDGLTEEEMAEMEMFRDESGDSAELSPLSDDELADLLADEKENDAPPKTSKGKKKKAAKQVLRPSSDEPTGKKLKVSDKKEKKKKAKKEKAEPAPLAAGLADLDDEEMPELRIKSSKKNKASGSKTANPFALDQYSGDADDATAFGEPMQLDAVDSAEKAAKKRTLQFHASAIETKSSQRNKAARDRLAGDADIPYRDRERSRMAVEAAKASRQKAMQQSADTTLDDEGWGEMDDRDWRDVMGVEKEASAGGDDGEDYYDLIASGKKQVKKARKDEYDAAREEARFIPEDTLEEGQHRGINRAIEKNKGLSAHRPKAARNPRVKKRIKYEAAKKKLSSKQAVFKGGQSSLQGGYGGEKSGISTNLVRSRKLG